MNREQLFTYLLIYCCMLGSTTCLFYAIRKRGLFTAVVCLTACALLPFFAAKIFAGENVMLAWLSRFSRGHLPVLAAAIAAVVPWVILFRSAEKQSDEPRQPGSWLSSTWIGIVFVGSFLLTVAAFTALMLVAPPIDEPLKTQVARMVEPGFELEHLIKLDFQPIRIAINQQGRVFVAVTNYTEGDGQEDGSILEVVEQPGSERTVRTVAFSSVLWRVFGLACKDEDLYVSRSGRSAYAHLGKVSYEKTGCITKLSDVDEDGEYKYYHDVVTGLPGSQGPISQHQCNGLLFRPDGSLLALSGNHGDRQLPKDDWEGCVLEISSDFQTVAPLATGLRNPFSMTLGPDGELFVVDQDWGIAGDEVNHIVRGGHYGHPYVVGKQAGKGFTAPIYLAKPAENLVAIGYAKLPGIDDCLLVSDLVQDKILALQLEREEQSFKVSSVREFALIKAAVDIQIAPDQSIYVLSRTGSVYRIRPHSGK